MGLAYGVLMALHIVYGLFFALVIVCLLRGAYHWAVALRNARRSDGAVAAPAQAPAPATQAVR